MHMRTVGLCRHGQVRFACIAGVVFVDAIVRKSQPDPDLKRLLQRLACWKFIFDVFSCMVSQRNAAAIHRLALFSFPFHLRR
jgi:hypothetical protein